MEVWNWSSGVLMSVKNASMGWGDLAEYILTAIALIAYGIWTVIAGIAVFFVSVPGLLIIIILILILR